jgi:ribA/ribD-fused uncharacterized protein
MGKYNTTLGRLLQSVGATKEEVQKAYELNEVIDSFEGGYEFLSNFYEVDFTWRGTHYPTAEHAFQAAKTLDPIYRQAIATAQSPGQAKRLGRAAKLRPDWEEVKEEIMYEVCRAKFTSSLYLTLALLSTGNKILIEGTTWHDNEWGNCICPNCKNIEGKNKLGKILMKIREELRNELMQIPEEEI